MLSNASVDGDRQSRRRSPPRRTGRARPLARGSFGSVVRRAVSSIVAALLVTFGAPGVATAGAERVAYRRATVDGISVFYREAGDPSRPTILLLHGFPSSSHMFRDLIPALSGHFHLLAPDYPGMGSSEAPPADRFRATFDGVADVVEKLVQQLGERQLIIYMQDFGGPVGMRLATRHPEWVRGLIFQNTPVSLDGWNPDRLKAILAAVGPETPERRAQAEGRVSEKTALFLYQHGARRPAELDPDAWISDDYALGKPEDRRIMTDLQLDIPSNLALYPSWQTWLRDHRPRTLVAWGRNDPIFAPVGAEAVRALIPEAEVRYYDTGHFALEEDGADIAEQIIRTFPTISR